LSDETIKFDTAVDLAVKAKPLPIPNAVTLPDGLPAPELEPAPGQITDTIFVPEDKPIPQMVAEAEARRSVPPGEGPRASQAPTQPVPVPSLTPVADGQQQPGEQLGLFRRTTGGISSALSGFLGGIPPGSPAREGGGSGNNNDSGGG
jgi:hypothetical protein